MLVAFSNWGPFSVLMAAPGVDIATTTPTYMEELLGSPIDELPDTYNRFSGTSLSAPFVTGAIAILLSVSPDLTPGEVVSILMDSADWSQGISEYVAGGRIYLPRMLMEAVQRAENPEP